jgi:hypothetical protein
VTRASRPVPDLSRLSVGSKRPNLTHLSQIATRLRLTVADWSQMCGIRDTCGRIAGSGQIGVAISNIWGKVAG